MMGIDSKDSEQRPDDNDDDEMETRSNGSTKDIESTLHVHAKPKESEW